MQDDGAGGGSGGGEAEGGSGGGSGSGSGSGRAPPVITGFDVALTTGTFWDFRWSSRTSSYGSQTGKTIGTFRVSLGASSVIAGKTAYAVKVQGESGGFAPRFKHLAASSEGFFGSTDGATWVTLLDTQTGLSAGGGFFRSLAPVFRARKGSFANSLISASGIVLERSSSTTDTVCVPGLGCVSGTTGDTTSSQRELYQPTVGPAGGTFFFSITQGSTSQSSTTDEVGLAATSLRGDAGLFEAETEPNDSPSAASQPLVTGKGMLGTFRLYDTGTSINGTYYSSAGTLLGTRGDTVQDCFTVDFSTALNKSLTLRWDPKSCMGCKFSLVLLNADGKPLTTASLQTPSFSSGAVTLYTFDAQLAVWGSQLRACVGTNGGSATHYVLTLK